MYLNKCTKCGVEFETKNPKRVICPSCLYPDRNPISLKSYTDIIGNGNQENPEAGNPQPEKQPQQRTSFQAGGEFRRPYQDNGYNRNQGGHQGGGFNRQQGGYNRPNDGGFNRQQGGYNRPQGGGFNRSQDGYNRPQGGYNRPQGGGYNRPQGGGFNRQQGGYNRPQGGGFNRPQGGGFRRPQGGGGGFRRGGPRPAARKSLLISREQVEQIEKLYRGMLPLPNPDAHEVIGKEMELEPNKVFFGINLVRQKMRLPKLPYPKRKLAVTTDQLTAIENLYSPLLPLPPIGCHKFIAKQLKMDEWRVHVGIGIIRKQMELPRWNPDREDAPEEFKQQRQAELQAQQEAPAQE